MEDELDAIDDAARKTHRDRLAADAAARRTDEHRRGQLEDRARVLRLATERFVNLMRSPGQDPPSEIVFSESIRRDYVMTGKEIQRENRGRPESDRLNPKSVRSYLTRTDYLGQPWTGLFGGMGDHRYWWYVMEPTWVSAGHGWLVDQQTNVYEPDDKYWITTECRCLHQSGSSEPKTSIVDPSVLSIFLVARGLI